MKGFVYFGGLVLAAAGLFSACGTPYRCPAGWHPDEQNVCVANKETGTAGDLDLSTGEHDSGTGGNTETADGDT